MSKAFVNEDSLSEDAFDSEEAIEAEDDSSSIPKGGKNYITLKGFELLKRELAELLHVERPKVVEVVAWAASNGDRSENADYTYGKKRLREIDKRLRFLQRRIDLAEVVQPEKQSGERVLFGATVTVRDESDAKRVYKIVGIDEVDARNGKVSWISPIGQALLQARAGDAVVVKTPKGDEELELLAVEYRSIE